MSICVIDQWNQGYNDGSVVTIGTTNAGSMTDSEVSITNKKEHTVVVTGIMVTS